MQMATSSELGDGDQLFYAETPSDAQKLCDAYIGRYSGPVAVDCEGADLNRDGDLSLLQIAIPGHAFLFDVQEIGGAKLFDGCGRELRRILEGSVHTKVFFDCRRDCDVLQQKFGIRVTNIRDLQLQDVLSRDDTKEEQRDRLRGFLHHGSLRGQPQNYQHVVRLKGLKAVLEAHGLGCKAKENVCGNEHRRWADRPLTDKQKQYALADTICIRDLYQKMQRDRGYNDEVLRKASEKYANTLRTLTCLPAVAYREHPLLPLCVIPGVPPVAREYPTVSCPKCKTSLPQSIFSKVKQRSKNFRCDVCRAVDIQASVQTCFDRNDDSEDGYDAGSFDFYSDRGYGGYDDGPFDFDSDRSYGGNS